MSKYLPTLFCMLAMFNTNATAELLVLNEEVKSELKKDQIRMFNSFCEADVTTFNSFAGDDFVTINADGTLMGKQGMAGYLPKFKGATYEIVEQEDRYYGNIAISTGRAKFYMKSVMVADVYFTQTWIYRDNKWSYIGWQGTMTGTPRYFPHVMTAGVGVLLLLSVGGISRLVRRKKNNQ